MTKRDKQDLRRIAQKQLQNKYGFKPSLKDIVLLEASCERKEFALCADYIMFSVGAIEYQWNIKSGLTIYEE